MNEDQQHLHAATVRLDAFEKRMDAFENALDANTRTTNAVKENTDFLVEITLAFRGLAKVLNWTGKLFKPVVSFIAAAVATYAAWKQTR